MAQLAILGAAHIHVPGAARVLAARGDVAVRHVYDPDAARAERWARELGARPAADPAAALADKEVAAVLVYSETVRHEELVQAACKARKHLFVEKPLAAEAADAFRLARLIERAGVIFQTGHFMRSAPVHRHLKALLDAGAFGQVTRAMACNAHDGALAGYFDDEFRWMADPARAGYGAFGDMGIHALDLLMWLLGPVQACSAMTSQGTARFEPADELGQGLLLFKSGALATLAASWLDRANPATLAISGTDAHAAVIRGELFITSAKLGLDGKAPVTAGLPEPAPAALELFLDAVVGKPDPRVPLVTPREAAERCAVIEALYKSAATGKRTAPKAGRPRKPRPAPHAPQG